MNDGPPPRNHIAGQQLTNPDSSLSAHCQQIGSTTSQPLAASDAVLRQIVEVYLERRFHQSGIKLESRSQLVRVAEALNCEMRPCGEFPRKVLAEAGISLTNVYLDEIFGSEGGQTKAPKRIRRRAI